MQQKRFTAIIDGEEWWVEQTPGEKTFRITNGDQFLVSGWRPGPRHKAIQFPGIMDAKQTLTRVVWVLAEVRRHFVSGTEFRNLPTGKNTVKDIVESLQIGGGISVQDTESDPAPDSRKELGRMAEMRAKLDAEKEARAAAEQKAADLENQLKRENEHYQISESAREDAISIIDKIRKETFAPSNKDAALFDPHTIPGAIQELRQRVQDAERNAAEANEALERIRAAINESDPLNPKLESIDAIAPHIKSSMARWLERAHSGSRLITQMKQAMFYPEAPKQTDGELLAKTKQIMEIYADIVAKTLPDVSAEQRRQIDGLRILRAIEGLERLANERDELARVAIGKDRDAKTTVTTEFAMSEIKDIHKEAAANAQQLEDQREKLNQGRQLLEARRSQMATIASVLFGESQAAGAERSIGSIQRRAAELVGKEKQLHGQMPPEGMQALKAVHYPYAPLDPDERLNVMIPAVLAGYINDEQNRFAVIPMGQAHVQPGVWAVPHYVPHWGARSIGDWVEVISEEREGYTFEISGFEWNGEDWAVVDEFGDRFLMSCITSASEPERPPLDGEIMWYNGEGQEVYFCDGIPLTHEDVALLVENAEALADYVLKRDAIKGESETNDQA